MSQLAGFNILQAFFAFRARMFRVAARERIRQELKHYPPHLAADICRDQLDEIPPKALETPEPTQRLRFFTSVTSQTGYFHR